MNAKILLTLTLFSGLMFAGHQGNRGSGKNSNTAATEQVQPLDKSTLTEDQKYSLAYMWHEEKLARDIYLELNKVNPARQLENIATKSEVKHIARVQELVEAYDINITNLADYEINYSAEELNAMPTGVFAVPEIQELYDALYDIGLSSKQASLEVGCMVEVVDIDDLDKFIETAGDNQYLIDAFIFLRDGSYRHYWAFDKGLKNMGITDGCCSVGEEYCHPEYPQGEKGKGKGGRR